MKRLLKQKFYLGWASLVVLVIIGLSFGGLYTQTARAQAANPAPTPSGGAGTEDAAAADGGEDVEVSCSSEGEAIGWIVCPVVKSTNSAIKAMDTAIMNLLTVDTHKLFGATGAKGGEKEISNAYHTAWSSFRIFALGFVVIMALVVIISTAFGYEILDAYTIRKVLPRILLAIIGITLSWSILEFLIGLTNDVGNGIRAIIYAPFNGIGLSNGNVIDIDDAAGVLSTVLLGAGFMVLGAMGMLSFGLTALLAVFCAFLVLVVRELIIIVLVIMAPIAIACLILPNTRKFWQIWQNTLTAMLLAFPIISAMIATGRVFSQVTFAFDNEDLVNNVIAFFAYILPYFMLPFAFKFAGGALATIGGLANDRSRGAFDRLRKYRGNKMEKNIHGMKTGQRFNEAGNFIPGSARMARRFNRTSGAVGTGMQGHFGMGERGRQAVSQQRELNALEGIMKNPKWATVNQNDDALRAMTYGSAGQAMADLTRSRAEGGQGWSQQRANAAVNSARASVGFGAGQQIAAARQLVSTGTGYGDLQDMSQVLGRAANGNQSAASSLAGFSNSEAKRTGRMDLAPSFGALDTLVQGEAGTLNRETGQRRTAPAQQAYTTGMRQAWNSSTIQQIVSGKGNQTQAFADHFTSILNDDASSGAHKRDAAIALSELQNALPSANGENQRIINDAMNRVGFDANGTESIESHMANRLVASNAAAGAGSDDLRAQIVNQQRAYGSNQPRATRGGSPDEGA